MRRLIVTSRKTATPCLSIPGAQHGDVFVVRVKRERRLVGGKLKWTNRLVYVAKREVRLDEGSVK